MPAPRSAGILLYRRRSDRLEVLLAHPGGPFWTKKDVGAWSVPKGEVDGDEEPLAAASREFVEELGHPVPAGEPMSLGDVTQKNRKVVSAWAVEGEFDPSSLESNTFVMEWPPRSGKLIEVPEVDRVEWFEADMARQKLNPAQAEFVERLEALLANQGSGAPPPAS